jgi:hypothetical protein
MLSALFLAALTVIAVHDGDTLVVSERGSTGRIALSPR